MPVRINILQGGIGIEFFSTGIVLGREIIDANSRIYTAEILQRLNYKILDRTTCTDYRVSADDVQKIVKQDVEASKINPNLTLIYVTLTPLQFGVTRMWQAYAYETGWESKIFQDRDSADAFIEEKFESSIRSIDDKV